MILSVEERRTRRKAYDKAYRLAHLNKAKARGAGGVGA